MSKRIDRSSSLLTSTLAFAKPRRPLIPDVECFLRHLANDLRNVLVPHQVLEVEAVEAGDEVRRDARRGFGIQ